MSQKNPLAAPPPEEDEGEEDEFDEEEEGEEEEGREEDEEVDEEDAELYEEFESCSPPTLSQVRAKVRSLIMDANVRIQDLQRMIGVEPGPDWNKFMNGRYSNPADAYTNNAFKRTAYFFWKEKRLGKAGKLTTLQRDAGVKQPPAKAARVAVTRQRHTGKTPLPDLMHWQSDGKTWLTPEEVRKETIEVFETYDATQGAVAEMINENPCMMGRFLKDKGEFGGSRKGCYHGLAQFLEKLRLATGTPKSRKRLAIEAEDQEEPFLGDDETKGYYADPGTSLFFARDEIGRQVVSQRKA